MSPELPLVAVLVLGVWTYAFRVTGPLTRHRFQLPSTVTRLLDDAAVVLLVALVATAALTAGQAFVGPARPVGVVVAGVLVWRRAPFPVVVLGAAATTAALRMTGLP